MDEKQYKMFNVIAQDAWIIVGRRRTNDPGDEWLEIDVHKCDAVAIPRPGTGGESMMAFADVQGWFEWNAPWLVVDGHSERWESYSLLYGVIYGRDNVRSALLRVFDTHVPFIPIYETLYSLECEGFLRGDEVADLSDQLELKQANYHERRRSRAETSASRAH
ncbi:MAG: hypothetical protein QM733_15680 [Ilumatobacteraceae bacterium]